MAGSSERTRKITVSLPADLVAYADEAAERLQTSRSQIISEALAEYQVSEQELLAAEGYQYYADEADAFADAAASAVSQAFDDER